LRNAVTPLLKNMGYGKGYRYIHDDPKAQSEMPCLPESLRDRVYLEEAEGSRNSRSRDSAPGAAS
jgi:putative ATPase